MLSRKYRFHGLGSVRPAMRHGVAGRDPFFTVKAMKTPKRSESRAAVVISKKAVSGAVARNRIRRRLLEVLRLNWQILPSPTDIVVIVHDGRLRDLAPVELEERLVTTVKSALKRLNTNSRPSA